MNNKSHNRTVHRLTVQNPLWLCLLIVVLFMTPYSAVNQLPLDRKIIPFILGEQFIPFLPWTLAIYLSAFVQTILIMRYMQPAFLRKASLIFSCAVVIGLVMFILWPIRYPRELFTSNSSIMQYFQQVDKDGNCLPSLHVFITICFSYCYSVISKSNLHRVLMWLWTLLIIVSVLTTKQHYLVDVFGGIVLALVAILILKGTIKPLPSNRSAL
jgi:membrane-associated phospholipid phosphatase